MGAEVGNGGSNGRGRRRAYVPMSQINVTPFVDVMLVLLIVFMITAPLLTVGVPIELPETRAEAVQGDKEPLTITVSAQGQVFLQETEVSVDELVPRLTAIVEGGYEERIYIRGDRAVDYGEVMTVMGNLNAAGFNRIVLVSEQANDG